MTARIYCPDCDGFGFIADAQCASCDGRGSLSDSELRRLIDNPPADLGDVLGALMIFAFLVCTPLAIAFAGMSRAVA